MAFLGGLFGSSSRGQQTNVQSTIQQQAQNQTQTTKQTQNQTQNTSTAQTQNTSGTSGQTGASTVSSLDPATLAYLRDNLIPQLTASLNQSGSSVDLDSIRSDAAGLRSNAGTDIQATIKAQQDAARQEFQQNQGAQIAQVQRQIGGGTGNSFAALLEQQGNVSLETNLAKIASDVTTQARAQSDQELAAAAGASGNAGNLALSQTAGPLQNLLAAIQTLAQGQQTSVSAQQGTTDTSTTGTGVSTTNTTDITDILQQLQGVATASADSVNNTNGQTFASQGVINDILSIFK